MVINNAGATIVGGGGAAICTGTFNNAANGVAISAHLFDLQGGGVLSQGSVSVSSGGDLYITGPGYNFSSGSILVDSSSSIDFHQGASTINFSYVNGGSVVVDGTAQLTANGTFDSVVDLNAGSASFLGTSTNFRAGSILQGAAVSSGNLAITVAGLDCKSGSLAGVTALAVLAGGSMTVEGPVTLPQIIGLAPDANSPGTLYLKADINTSSSFTFAGASLTSGLQSGIVDLGGGRTFNISGSGVGSIRRRLTNGNLTKTGPGELELADSNFAGTINQNQGTLLLSNDNNTYALTGTIDLNGGTFLNVMRG